MDFDRQSYGNWKFLVANHAITKTFHMATNFFLVASSKKYDMPLFLVIKKKLVAIGQWGCARWWTKKMAIFFLL
jgi:hypothetical protein